MARQSAPTEQVTRTGIRIVGRAAAELASAAGAMPLAPPPPRDAVWAARFRVRLRLGSGSPVPALLDAVASALRADWDGCPAVTRDTPFSRPAGRLRGISWDVFGDPGAWRGELVWRHPHPRLAGSAMTTHLVIDEQQQITTLGMVAAADGGVTGVRGIVGVGQSRPPLLDILRSVVSLMPLGDDGEIHVLDNADVEPFVRMVLLDDDRTWPVAVLTPRETGGYLVPPDQIAAELFGIAPLFVIARHSGTFALTDAVGDRRLSAYWGALRVYRPEFSCADRSDDHWLLMRDRLEDPLERASLLGSVALSTRDRIVPLEGVAARREAAVVGTVVLSREDRAEVEPQVRSLPPAAEPTASLSGITPVTLDVGPALADLPAVIAELAMQMHELAGAVSHLVGINARLGDEIARLRTATAIRATGSQAIERRLERIQAVISPESDGDDVMTSPVPTSADGDEDEIDSLPTLLDAVRQAATDDSDALLILDSAEVSAANSPFVDVDRAAAVLQAVAYVSRRRQEGGLGSGLRAAFRELGLDYRAQIGKSTSDKLRQQYRFLAPNGETHDCYEHIAVGSTYDPRYCLRIYFTSRAPSEPRFVIGHVGRHLTVMSST